MKYAIIPAALGLAMVALPAAAQEEPAEQQQQAMDEQTMEDAAGAAEAMVGRVYVYEPATPVPPAMVIERLQELGYTNIHDFDVEWGEYEVEAMSPAGDDVEIEIDPITGAILEIDEDFF
jgi:uncharacterized membrane protein YkoI